MKMSFPEINLHIHSTFSDGKDSIRKIVKSALKLNLEYIAITDHFTDSWKAWVSKLKDIDKISEYLGEITQCKNYLRENGKKLTLFKGLEVDLGSSAQFIKKNIQAYNFDLILFEYLQSVETIGFVKNIINFWKRKSHIMSEFPILGLAHLDPFYFIHGNLDILVSFLKNYNIYFEFNPRYPTHYSRQNLIFFEKIRDENIPVAIGCDSHSISTLNNIQEPLEMINYYNLESNFQILINILESKF